MGVQDFLVEKRPRELSERELRIVSLKCPNCAAPVTRDATRCDYCGYSYQITGDTSPLPAVTAGQLMDSIKTDDLMPRWEGILYMVAIGIVFTLTGLFAGHILKIAP